jgi:hypothetical protein
MVILTRITTTTNSLSRIGLGNGLNPGELMFLGTPDAQIEIFNPSLFNLLPWGCVLVGSPVTLGPGASFVPVPKLSG